jgi:transcriptional regulator with XRE-family HTH domain
VEHENRESDSCTGNRTLASCGGSSHSQTGRRHRRATGRRPRAPRRRPNVRSALEPIDLRVRQRLRELRGERGLTLADVAERARIDVSTLSRLESGKRRLALDHIPALADALGVSTDELLGSRPRQDPRVRARPRRIHGLTLWPLTQRGSSGGLHAYKVTISAKRRTPPDRLPVHEGPRLAVRPRRETAALTRRGRAHHQAGRGR